MFRRDLSHEPFSRELQALDKLFSREPEDRPQWAKRGTYVGYPGKPDGKWVSFHPKGKHPKKHEGYLLD